MFDTHCHLNFSRFKDKVDLVVKEANRNGVTHILVPGTDIKLSQRAVQIADTYEGVYAAVGIHPHHIVESQKSKVESQKNSLFELEKHLLHPKVVAVGEVGIDRHTYQLTKYTDYKVDENQIKQQKELLQAQIRLALKYKKSLILHNREAKSDMLTLLSEYWSDTLSGRTVFHCCEPDAELLTYAKEHHIFIGVDGDITYDAKKQEFIKNVPLELLVLETDSPYLLPEPLRSAKQFPNTPSNIPLIASFVGNLKGVSVEDIRTITSENGKKLFSLPEDK